MSIIHTDGNNKQYLPISIFIPLFILIFTILLAIVGWFVSAYAKQTDKIEVNRENIYEIQGDIKAINTNMGNIIKSLDEIKLELKKGR